MNIRFALNEAKNKLQPIHILCAEDQDLGQFEAEILLAHLLDTERAWLLAHREDELPIKLQRQFFKLVSRRIKHEPIAQIIGYKDFYGRSFSINKHVLTPRPDTELLIETALPQITKQTVVWDIGTGSGAIAITLACEKPGTSTLATDVSTRALTIAKRNAETLHVPISFLKSNLLQKPSYAWLQKQSATHSHLLICANLPYLPNSDKKKLEQDVVKYEPKSALFSGNDGNDLILRCMRQLSRHLHEWKYTTVTLLFEFDPPQAKTLQAAASKLFPQATSTILKDLAGLDRLLVIQYTITPNP